MDLPCTGVEGPWRLLFVFCLFKGAEAGVADGQGPLLILEPPVLLEMSNSTGGRLDCMARGSPTPSISWVYFDGQSVTDVPSLRYKLDNGSLVFSPFSAAEFRPDVHRTVYRCLASNTLGIVLSRDVHLRAVVMQEFSVTAGGGSATRGSAAVLRCHVPSFVRSLVTVTSWLQDQTFNIFPSTDGDGKYHMLPNGELIIWNVSPSDNFHSYQCRVTHRLTGKTVISEGNARVTVIEPRGQTAPTLSETSIVLEVRRDERLVIPCLADSHPSSFYRWEINGVTLPEDNHRYPTGSGLLVFPRARTSDLGSYTCIASNSAGSAILHASLLVTSPLSARLSPSIVTASLKESVKFSCIAGGQPVLSFSWAKNGHHLPDTKDYLEVLSVTREDQGMYQCFVKNEHDMAQASAELHLGDTPPHLVYRFIRQTIQPGPSISLKCVASGNPTPNIRWDLDGFPLPQNERFMIGQYLSANGDVVSHVNITSVHVEDGGTYTCKAANRVDEINHNAQLNVYGSPYIRPMGEISAVAGETLKVTCPVAGYPIDTKRWYQGERLLPVHRRHLVFPNGTLVIEKVQAGVDNGTYRCWASTKNNKNVSAIARINIMVPPKITPFSFRMDLHIGERVGLQCVISKGDAPLNIRWLKDNQELASYGSDGGLLLRSFDQFTSVLTIERLARDHGGNYTCIARNAAASAQYTAQLQVNVPPAISPFAFGELSEGERARVTCTVKRGDPPLAISWLKDARPMTPHDLNHLDLTIQHVEEYSSVLAIPSVSSRHSGNYTCVARNTARTASFTTQLLVTVPPSWVVEPQNVEVKLGQQAILNCKAEGFPQPTISWKKASGENTGLYVDLHSRRGVQIFENGSLVLESANPDDQSNYLCEANNGIGIGLSSVIALTVHVPVRFKVRSRKELAQRRSTAILRCHAFGDLPINITWRKEGTNVALLDRISIKKSSKVTDGVLYELTVQDLRSEDGGTYTCTAKNNFGQDQMIFHLLVQEAPAVPTSVHVVSEESRKATIAWTPALDGNSPITKYLVRFAQLQADSWQDGIQEVEVFGSQTSAIITGLQPASSYVVYVVAENNLGPGLSSAEIRIQTKEENPSSPPRQVSVEATASTELLLKWLPPPEEDHNGRLLGHYIGFRELSEADNIRQYNFTTVPWRTDEREELRLKNLKKFSKYGIVIQAYNRKGPGPLSAEIVTQTLEDVPEAAPRDVRCGASSEESITVSWQPPPDSLVHGVIQGYRLKYEPQLTQETFIMDSSDFRTKLTPALSLQLHGLLKYTNYSMEIVAYTRMGDGVKSSKIYCRTKEDVPGPPARIKAFLANSDTAIVAWLPPLHPNGIIIKYNIYVRLVDGIQQIDSRSIPHLLTKELHYELRGLKRRLKYEFWITAFTRIGEGQSTSVISLNVSTQVPAAIISFGGRFIIPWKSQARLDCRLVGVPIPERQWLQGDIPMTRISPAQPSRARITISGEGSLQITDTQRNDQGEYTCEAWNEFGKDMVKYLLIVQVPPSAPLLLATSKTQSSIQLQWKLGDNGGSRIRLLILRYRIEHGEWQEKEISISRSTYTLVGLRCGSFYHVEASARNAVGVGMSSNPLTVRTKGTVPLKPNADVILGPNMTSVMLHLDRWPDGGCPIFYFIVEYMPHSNAGPEEWLVVGNKIQSNRPFEILGLNSGTTYRIRITAHNTAGSTVTQYLIKTPTTLGATIGPIHVESVGSEESVPFHKDVKLIVLSILSVFALLLSLFGICYCLNKRTRPNLSPSLSVEDVRQAETQENKQNLTRREQYYATVRKLPPSPIPLECIPEYSEDIRPYATFHVPGSRISEATKLQTFLYRENDNSTPTRKSMKIDYCRGKKCRAIDDNDSYGSESDTEPGTSSRTESLNHLDDGSLRMNPSKLTEWSPPGHHLHLQAPRRYCHAHLLK